MRNVFRRAAAEAERARSDRIERRESIENHQLRTRRAEDQFGDTLARQDKVRSSQRVGERRSREREKVAVGKRRSLHDAQRISHLDVGKTDHAIGGLAGQQAGIVHDDVPRFSSGEQDLRAGEETRATNRDIAASDKTAARRRHRRNLRHGEIRERVERVVRQAARIHHANRQHAGAGGSRHGQPRAVVGDNDVRRRNRAKEHLRVVAQISSDDCDDFTAGDRAVSRRNARDCRLDRTRHRDRPETAGEVVAQNLSCDIRQARGERDGVIGVRLQQAGGLERQHRAVALDRMRKRARHRIVRAIAQTEESRIDRRLEDATETQAHRTFECRRAAIGGNNAAHGKPAVRQDQNVAERDARKDEGFRRAHRRRRTAHLSVLFEYGHGGIRDVEDLHVAHAAGEKHRRTVDEQVQHRRHAVREIIPWVYVAERHRQVARGEIHDLRHARILAGDVGEVRAQLERGR